MTFLATASGLIIDRVRSTAMLLSPSLIIVNKKRLGILSGFAYAVAVTYPCKSPIQRTHHAPAALVQHMRVDHRRGNIGMAEQLLHGADVVTTLQQMRGKSRAQGVRCGKLGNAWSDH